jgi:tetratricopeptide (TPR) repeat protein
MLGKTRALTYDGRHTEAIAVTDHMLAERWYLGDAWYWRAFNLTNLERYDEAWHDIGESAKLQINADVPKLAGIIAYRRKELEVSRAKFEASLAIRHDDCETFFFFGTVLAELKLWQPSTGALNETVACLDRAEQAVKDEIERIGASTAPEERKAHQIVRRRQQVASIQRMRVTSWFDLAVDYYSLANSADARSYAEKVVDDEQFGARAREILSRSK